MLIENAFQTAFQLTAGYLVALFVYRAAMSLLGALVEIVLDVVFPQKD